MNEFFTKDKDYVKDNHELDDRLIEAIQYIRDITGQPIKITSSFRSESYNRLVGGAENSYHVKGRALDWKFVNDSALMVRQFKKMYYDPDTNLKANLDYYGIRGVIFYDTFIHIDTRGEEYVNDRTNEKSIAGFLLVLGLILFKSIL